MRLIGTAILPSAGISSGRLRIRLRPARLLLHRRIEERLRAAGRGIRARELNSDAIDAIAGRAQDAGKGVTIVLQPMGGFVPVCVEMNPQFAVVERHAHGDRADSAGCN